MTLPTYFISHGGGPCFDMDWPGGNPFEGLRTYLSGFSATVPQRPAALLVISAHWEATLPSVTSTPTPTLIYDYTNFPPHTYSLRYDVPGSPELAARVVDVLGEAGIASRADTRRGLDHGVFVPFRLMYPAADIPLVQLSLVAGYDPATHLAIGAALAPLRDEGVLIVGSGMSYHNFEKMRDGNPGDAARFDRWLVDAMTGDVARREDALRGWSSAPAAREAHPEEDHLVPLFVAAGAAVGERGEHAYRDTVHAKAISGFRFG